MGFMSGAHLHFKTQRDMRWPHTLAAVAKFTALTVLLSASPLAAQGTAHKRHVAAAPTPVTQKSPPAQPAQTLRAAAEIKTRDSSASTYDRDTIMTDGRIIQCAQPKRADTGMCIAAIETIFGIAGRAELRVTEIIPQVGIRIANPFGMVMTDQGSQHAVIVRDGETKIIGIASPAMAGPAMVTVHLYRGGWVTARFVPTYASRTYELTADGSVGAIIGGPPPMRLRGLDSRGVRVFLIFEEKELYLVYNQPVMLMQSGMYTGIGARKESEPGHALLFITAPDGVAELPPPAVKKATPAAKKQKAGPKAKPRPHVKTPVKHHAKSRK